MAVVKGKSHDGVRELGGVKGIAASMVSSSETGVSGDSGSLSVRQRLFGSKSNKMPRARCFLSFVWEAFKDDPVLVIVLACVALSIWFGIKDEHGIKQSFYDGLSILIAISLVVSIPAVTKFWQARRLPRLSNECSNILHARVIRDTEPQDVTNFDVVAGDIVCLDVGDQVPADGLFLEGDTLQVDEPTVTGEIKLLAVDACTNPFLTSGAKVTCGVARMLVTTVGMDINELTPLQTLLQKLTSSIRKIGTAVVVLIFSVLLVHYFTGSTKNENGIHRFDRKNLSFYSVLKVLLSILLDAIAIEGLPLVVTVNLAYSMKRMMRGKAMVMKPPACETMGSVTAICTNKTGTLTLNEMDVARYWTGEEEFGCNDDDDDNNNNINNGLLKLLHQGVGLNTTASVTKLSLTSEPEFSGGPTEKAILSWAVKELDMDVEGLKQHWEILHVEAFLSDRKRSGVTVRSRDNNAITVHWKGAAEMILASCSHYCNAEGIVREIDAEKRTRIEQIIQGMATDSLRCIAFAYKHLESEDNPSNDEDEELTLLGIVGLKNPCLPGARTAVETCIEAGVDIKLVTGDNITTAKSTALECGILKPDDSDIDAVIEGESFRRYPEEQRMEMVDRIRVMARASPSDKLLMVQCLMKKNHVVAVVGDGKKHAPVLKVANVGFSTGNQGTEVVEGNSNIVILDHGFDSVAKVLMWGRYVYNNIQKLIQVLLTVNTADQVLNLVSAVSSGTVLFTTVEQCSVNLIMVTIGGLALATVEPAEELMKKPPVYRTQSLVTNAMWRDLLAQALFQVAATVILLFWGGSIFGVDEHVKKTMVFNTFVLCQVFNLVNVRMLEKKNVFEGILKNRRFLGIISTIVILQVVMVEFMKRFADTERLDWGQWGFCVAIGFLSLPIGWAFKGIPVSDKPISEWLKHWKAILETSLYNSLP